MRRKITLATGEYYHVFNRGTDKREVFSCENDYFRFLQSLKEFNTEEPIGSIYEESLRCKTARKTYGPPRSKDRIVDIICYCLNPNHYHLILRQVKEKGVEKFMSRLGNGYTKYYNQKNNRSGVLFQGPFKSTHIDSNDYLLYVSAYVNMNHFIHGYEGDGPPRSTQGIWRYSSLGEYLGEKGNSLCDKSPIIGQFKNLEEYKIYLDKNALYFKEKKEMEE